MSYYGININTSLSEPTSPFTKENSSISKWSDWLSSNNNYSGGNQDFIGGFLQRNFATPIFSIKNFNFTYTNSETQFPFRFANSRINSTPFFQSIYFNGISDNTLQNVDSFSPETKSAFNKTEYDSLEELNPSGNWSVSDASFINDLPLGRKGISRLLDQISEQVTVPIVITSALGTETSPHTGKESGTGHYDKENPKLDFGGGLNKENANKLASQLMATGHFEFANVEANKNGGYHIDAKIKASSCDAYATT